MQHKSTSIIIGIIIVILAVVAITMANRSDTPPGTAEPTGIVEPVSTSTPSTATSTATTTALKTYTLAEIAPHKSASNCWTTIDGSVYDISTFVTKHPGGVAAITKICGKDGSSIFNAQHGGKAKQAAILATLKIGILAQ